MQFLQLNSIPTTKPNSHPLFHHHYQIPQSSSSIILPISRYSANLRFHAVYEAQISTSSSNFVNSRERRRNRGDGFCVKASSNRRETPYQVLGVSPSSSVDEIKRAYRKLALKFHPDVNKQPGAQEKFMKIKHAYNTLTNSGSRKKYDAGESYSYSTTDTSRSRNTQQQEEEEEFYGFGNFVRDVQISLGDFFKDIQQEYQNWEATSGSQGKPKSLWEELADIGEEFVEFLEKELNIPDPEDEGSRKNNNPFESSAGGTPGNKNTRNKAGSEKSSIEDNIDDIEATLAQLKKELGL